MTLFIHDGETIPAAPDKDPDSVMDYGVDHSAWLDTDTISASEWLIDNTLITAPGQTVNGLTAGTSTFDATTTTIWLSGGTELSTYDLTNRVTTAAGRTDDRTMTVRVRQK